jgi:negative regulator of flagellin synthesis FlgM
MMKIDQLVANIPSTKVGSGTAKSAKSVDGGNDVASSSDSVKISEDAKSIASASSSSAVFDAKKVADIKAAIAEGRFQVNSEMVADGLIASVKDLIQSRSNKA